MKTIDNNFFSWTARRFPLPSSRMDPDLGNLDLGLMVGGRSARLLAFDDTRYTVLVVGEVFGASDVPMRIVVEELLLIAGARSHRPAEILIAAEAQACTPLHAELVRQLCGGGSLRELAIGLGARSVVVDWFDPVGKAA
ncbi:hypothetical protein [Nocardia vaccinii]|uniref:hypothetical protein n=1 Tax=Nocardia vaccinii TaxID=1822 RepID=UPI000834E6EE|nr:hypothetical protein [Nocardia vaccinii]